jgi:hypothetical protein
MGSDVRLVVELDILSGRPNPRWPMAGDQAAAWQSRLAGAGRPAASSVGVGPALGYRGLLVLSPTTRWRVFGGRVESAGRVHLDETAERELLATMPPELRRQYGPALPRGLQ